MGRVRAGSSKASLEHIPSSRERGVTSGFSVGWSITEGERAAITAIPSTCGWRPGAAQRAAARLVPVRRIDDGLTGRAIPCDTGSVGLRKWFRNSVGKSAGALSAGLGELDAFYLPERRHQLDGLKRMKSMSMMRDDEEAGAPPRPVDLGSGTAVIKVSTTDPDSGR